MCAMLRTPRAKKEVFGEGGRDVKVEDTVKAEIQGGEEVHPSPPEPSVSRGEDGTPKDNLIRWENPCTQKEVKNVGIARGQNVRQAHDGSKAAGGKKKNPVPPPRHKKPL